MPGGTAIPYGNVGNMFAIGVTVTTQTITGTFGGEVTFTVPGLQTTDVILDVNKPSATQYISITNAYAKSANTLAIGFGNTSTGNITTPASEIYKCVVVRPDLPPGASLPTAIV